MMTAVMRRLRAAISRHCSLSLCLSLLLFQLLAMVLFVALRGRGGGKLHGQFYNADAGQKMCLQRSSGMLPPDRPADRPVDQPLILAPCQSQSHFTAKSQGFRLDFEGHLLSPAYDPRAPPNEELCVDSHLRLDICRDEQEIWVFTQGSGLVHVESALCLTRDPGSRLSLRRCDNRPEQYWWYHLEGRNPPE